MHYKAILAALTFSAAVLGAAVPPPYQVSSSSDPSSSADPPCTPITTITTKTKFRKKTSTTTTTETKNITIFPPCPISTCTKPTITKTVTSIDTVNRTITDTTTITGPTATATPGPVVELAAYAARSCAVDPVASNGNAPNFQEIQLIYNAATASSQCRKINANSGSFSWDVVSFTDVSSSCHLYFYFGSDSCFDDNGGSQQISLNNGEGACHNLRNVKSVRLFC